MVSTLCSGLSACLFSVALAGALVERTDVLVTAGISSLLVASVLWSALVLEYREVLKWYV